MKMCQMERPSNTRQRENMFSTAHQLYHEDLHLAVSVSEVCTLYGFQKEASLAHDQTNVHQILTVKTCI